METKSNTTITDVLEGLIKSFEDNVDTQRNLCNAVHEISLALERIDARIDDLHSRIKELEK